MIKRVCSWVPGGLPACASVLAVWLCLQGDGVAAEAGAEPAAGKFRLERWPDVKLYLEEVESLKADPRFPRPSATNSLVAQAVCRLEFLETVSVTDVVSVARELVRGEPPPPPVVEVEPVVPEVPEDWEGARRMLNLQPIGTTQEADGSTSAILKNMRTIRVGDNVSAVHLGWTYHWRVKAIEKGKIITENLGVDKPGLVSGGGKP